ncbi:MAG: hypothetical protein HUJ89_01945 [Bacteroidales bacterium]|nr:hypothetical protein [Bacteroidales bacterium]
MESLTNTPLKEFSNQELEDCLKISPWFSLAHAEKALRCNDFKSGLLYLNQPYKLMADGRRMEPIKIKREKAPARVVVVGGDYFSNEDYRKMDSNAPIDICHPFLDSEFVPLTKDDYADFTDERYYTETLAKIYADQGLNQKALEVYSKLILLYPEKNTYFAALIQEIKKHL